MHQGANGSKRQQYKVEDQVERARDECEGEQDQTHNDEADRACDQRREDQQKKCNYHAASTQTGRDFVATTVDRQPYYPLK